MKVGDTIKIPGIPEGKLVHAEDGEDCTLLHVEKDGNRSVHSHHPAVKVEGLKAEKAEVKGGK